MPAKGTTNSTPAKSSRDTAKRSSEKKRSAKSTTPKSTTRRKSNAGSKATPSTPKTGKSTTPVRRSLRSDLDKEAIDSAPRAVGPQSAHTPAAGTNRSGKQRGATTRTPPLDSKSPDSRKRPARNTANADNNSGDEIDAPAAHTHDSDDEKQDTSDEQETANSHDENGQSENDVPQYCEIDTCGNAPTAWCDGCSLYVCSRHENDCACPNEPEKQPEQEETEPTQLAVLNNLATTMAISAQTQADNAQRAVQQEKEQDFQRKAEKIPAIWATPNNPMEVLRLIQKAEKLVDTFATSDSQKTRRERAENSPHYYAIKLLAEKIKDPGNTIKTTAEKLMRLTTPPEESDWLDICRKVILKTGATNETVETIGHTLLEAAKSIPPVIAQRGRGAGRVLTLEEYLTTIDDNLDLVRWTADLIGAHIQDIDFARATRFHFESLPVSITQMCTPNLEGTFGEYIAEWAKKLNKTRTAADMIWEAHHRATGQQIAQNVQGNIGPSPTTPDKNRAQPNNTGQARRFSNMVMNNKRNRTMTIGAVGASGTTESYASHGPHPSEAARDSHRKYEKSEQRPTSRRRSRSRSRSRSSSRERKRSRRDDRERSRDRDRDHSRHSPRSRDSRHHKERDRERNGSRHHTSERRGTNRTMTHEQRQSPRHGGPQQNHYGTNTGGNNYNQRANKNQGQQDKICKKLTCNRDHDWYNCPHVVCRKCNGKGHTAMACKAGNNQNHGHIFGQNPSAAGIAFPMAAFPMPPMTPPPMPPASIMPVIPGPQQNNSPAAQQPLNG